jgi:hypothetical protein
MAGAASEAATPAASERRLIMNVSSHFIGMARLDRAIGVNMA